uniref:hypothetical protein n=1 Tax=Pseudomonas syringae TaxID=317 RepID=UPI001FFB1D7C
AGLTLHHGTSMPIRDFGRTLGTGKSLSFAKCSGSRLKTRVLAFSAFLGSDYLRVSGAVGSD